MHIDDLEYFMDIARTFNNVPRNGNGLELCRFEELPPGVEARHETDGELQYVIINSSFNKSNFQLNELGYLMGVFVHEYRHLWQENYDQTGYFLNLINKTDFNIYHDTWIEHEFEQDAEAIKYLFYSEVLQNDVQKDPKFMAYKDKVKSKIEELMMKNKNFVNIEGALEKMKASKEAFSKYIK